MTKRYALSDLNGWETLLIPLNMDFKSWKASWSLATNVIWKSFQVCRVFPSNSCCDDEDSLSLPSAKIEIIP